MKMRFFQIRFLYSLIVLTGVFLCWDVSADAQTRAIKPVRIEAKTAQNETVSYIYAESHALVIGVSQYRNGWSNLPGVQDDVEEVSQSLKANGFEVTTIEDPGLDELENAIEDFIFEKGTNPENRLLIYYAGHGHTMTLGYGGEMGFLVPADAPVPQKGRDAKFRRQALSMQRIEEVAKNTSAKHVLFMFDACFAGSVFLATRAAPAYIQQNTKEPVRQFITSGSAEQEVPDKSIFRRAFVDALNGKADYDKDGYLTGTELGSYIQKRTAEDWEGKLTPQYGKLQDPNLNKGDFVFELSKPEVVKPPPAEPAPVAPPPDLAAQAWNIIEPSTDPAVFQAFVERFPDAPQRQLAELKLMVLPKAVTEKTDTILPPDKQTKSEKTDLITKLEEAKTPTQTTPKNIPSPLPEVTNSSSQQALISDAILSGEAAKTQLLKTKKCIGCDLRGTDLSGTTLREAKLSGANLSGSTLEGAYLVRVDLSDANLKGTNLRDASLRKADISGTDITKAFLCNTFMPDGSINNRDCEPPETSPTVQATTTEDFEATSERLQQKTDSGAGRRYKWNPDIVEDRLVRGHWQRQPHLNPENQSAKSYFDAKSYCEGLNLSGWENWRLPTRRELVSLFEERSPAKINLDLFAVDYENNDNYWSKTREVVGMTERVWTIDFGKRTVNTNSYSSKHKTICLRSWNVPSKTTEEVTDSASIEPGPTQAAVNKIPKSFQKGIEYSVYQEMQKRSAEVIGCGFFHVGCVEEGLSFPAYQPDFHLKGYRRVNLWGKDRPWTDTELQVKNGDVVYFYGTGEVTTCPDCTGGGSGPQKLNQSRLGYLIGEDETPIMLNRFNRLGYNLDSYISRTLVWRDGYFKITVRDWNTYPPPSNYYDDNSGVYIFDIFVIDPDQEEGFNRFKDALFEANPDDANVKAYLGR